MDPYRQTYLVEHEDSAWVYTAEQADFGSDGCLPEVIEGIDGNAEIFQ